MADGSARPPSSPVARLPIGRAALTPEFAAETDALWAILKASPGYDRARVSALTVSDDAPGLLEIANSYPRFRVGGEDR